MGFQTNGVAVRDLPSLLDVGVRQVRNCPRFWTSRFVKCELSLLLCVFAFRGVGNRAKLLSRELGTPTAAAGAEQKARLGTLLDIVKT